MIDFGKDLVVFCIWAGGVHSELEAGLVEVQRRRVAAEHGQNQLHKHRAGS